MMIQDLNSPEHIATLMQHSHERPVFLFKHSSACFTSAYAWRIFQRFATSETRAEYWCVRVRESRALSQEVARQTQVPHESPQVLLIHQGHVIWHDSHEGITATALEKNFNAVLAHEKLLAS